MKYSPLAVISHIQQVRAKPYLQMTTNRKIYSSFRVAIAIFLDPNCVNLAAVT